MMLGENDDQQSEMVWFYEKLHDFTRDFMILRDIAWFYERWHDFTRDCMILGDNCMILR